MNNHDEQDFDSRLRDVLAKAAQWNGSPHAMFHKVRRKLRLNPWYSRIRPLVAVGATALSLILALGVYHYTTFVSPPLPDDRAPAGNTSPSGSAVKLPVVGSQEKLLELIEKSLENRNPASEKIGSTLNRMASSAKGYSSTNIQVEGVDEADIIKTDGKYLYQIRSREITISQIYPHQSMQVMGRVKLPDDMHPQEMYLDENILTVISIKEKGQISEQAKSSMIHRRILPTDTIIQVYDITDTTVPVKIREVEIEGSPVSTRKVGSVVYLVAQKQVIAEPPDGDTVIHYRDSARENNLREIGLDNICYFPNTSHEAFLTVLTLDTSNGSKEAKVDVYLGSGRTIYMSQDNLYVVLQQWVEVNEGQAVEGKTLVHKFSVHGTDVLYQGMGEVPGSILNQFSMDEYNGNFRIATTSHRKETESNVYILDQNLQLTGALEGLAPGEQIYSVRFTGDKGYLVTFELVDPLFVINLQDPANPQVLGELKIPGFSNYLHPLDEKTLLGIGHDTEVKVVDGRDVVREKGLKLAIFDVSDVNNPKELHVETIGGEGSYTEASWNHKAVMFYRDILALPVYAGHNRKVEYQGAVAYRVSKENGFKQLGKVTHYTDGNPATDNLDYERSVLRSLISNDVFYTVSNNYIRANRLTEGLPDLARLTLK